MLSSTDDVKKFVPLFINHSFVKDDSFTPIKIAIATKLPLILAASPEGLVIAAILLIDDVPLIRSLTAAAVSKHLNSQFLCEVELFDLILKKLDQKQLKFLGLKWIELIEMKLKCDPNGESISTVVDEFFVVQKVCLQLKLNNSDFDFEKVQFMQISDARIRLIRSIKPLFK